MVKFKQNIGIILRNEEKKVNIEEVKKIKKICNKQKIQFYLYKDIKLALRLKLDGVYIPSYYKNLRIKVYKLSRKFSIIGSAHNVREIRIKEKQGVNMIFLSPIFKINKKLSYLGLARYNNLSNQTKIKNIALGGINTNNIKSLKLTNAYGFASISYLKNNSNIDITNMKSLEK